MLKESIGCPLLSISPLGTKGRDGQAGLKTMLKESIGHPLLSISPLWTKELDGQAGLRAMLKEYLGILYCHYSFMDKGSLKFSLDSQWQYWTTGGE